jgi:tetratricopeptide (TPR) repeat protein
LVNAKQSLAQAEANFRAAGKRRSLTIPIVVLVVAGMVGGSLNPTNLFQNDYQTRKAIQHIDPQSNSDMNAEARKFFDAAMDYRKAKTYDRALSMLSSAHLADAASEMIWDEWSYTYYLAGQYKDAIQTAKDAPHFGKKYRPYKNLGLAYAAQGQWTEAKEAYNQARLFKEIDIDRENIEILYLLGQALSHTGELAPTIMLAQSQFTATPFEAKERQARLLVTLALYRCWQNDLPSAQSALQSLKLRNVELAGYVEELINSHPSQAVPEKAPKKK